MNCIDHQRNMLCSQGGHVDSTQDTAHAVFQRSQRREGSNPVEERTEFVLTFLGYILNKSYLYSYKRPYK